MSHTIASITHSVRQLVGEQAAIEPTKISEIPVSAHVNVTPPFKEGTPDDLGLDSLDAVELVMSLEDEFDIEIPDEDADKLLSVGDMIRYVCAQKNVAVPEGAIA